MDQRRFTSFTVLLLVLASGAAYVYAHPSVIGLPLSYNEAKEAHDLFTESTSTIVLEKSLGTTSTTTP